MIPNWIGSQPGDREWTFWACEEQSGCLLARERQGGSSAPIELVALGNVVRWVRDFGSPRELGSDGEPFQMPLARAAQHVLDVLRATPSAPMYWTNRVDYASEVGAGAGSGHGPVGTMESSPHVWADRERFLAEVERHWECGLEESWRSLFCVNMDGGSVVAIRLADAKSLFAAFDLAPTGDACASSAVHEPNAEKVAPSGAAVEVIQPKGGVWPHIKGTPWTDDEREAMFLMRHKQGVSDKQLAKVVGVSRQCIDGEIGPKKLRGKAWPEKNRKWRPSEDLLRTCGLQLTPNPLLALLAGKKRA